MSVMNRALLGLGTFAALSACSATPEQVGIYDYATLEAQAYRAYAASYSETPFANGAMSVIAAEGDELRNYALVPCAGGTTVCAGTAHGQRGTVTRTPDYHVVRGLYRGRTFYLSPGGDGAVQRGGATWPLAWDSIRED